jgi:hypothetical protein
MVSSGMLHIVALVRTAFSEELMPSIIRVAGTLAVINKPKYAAKKYYLMYVPLIYVLHVCSTILFLRSLFRFLVVTNLFHSTPVLITLMMEAIGSFKTSVLTRAIRRNISEDYILHSHRREHINSYIIHVLQ